MPKSRSFKCDKCCSAYKDYKYLVEHQRYKHGKYIYVYECPVCGKTCTKKYNLQVHFEHAHGVTLLDVEACIVRIVNSQNGK